MTDDMISQFPRYEPERGSFSGSAMKHPRGLTERSAGNIPQGIVLFIRIYTINNIRLGFRVLLDQFRYLFRRDLKVIVDGDDEVPFGPDHPAKGGIMLPGISGQPDGGDQAREAGF